MPKQRQNPRKNDKSQVGPLYLDRWRGRTPTKSVYRQTRIQIRSLTKKSQPNKNSKNLLVGCRDDCRDWIRSCNVIGFESIRIRPSTRIQKIKDSKVFTLERGSKVSGFTGRIHRMRVDDKRIRKKKYPDTCGRGLKLPPWKDLPKTRFRSLRRSRQQTLVRSLRRKATKNSIKRPRRCLTLWKMLSNAY